MSGLKPLGDPNAVVCDGDVCAVPWAADPSTPSAPTAA